MSRLFAVLFMLLLPLFAYAEMAKPVVVLYERNPWLSVIGSDDPTFIAYNNGQIIWRNSKQKETTEYLSVKLTPDELTKFLAGFEGVFALDNTYTLMGLTDQPTTELTIHAQGRTKSIEVYGLSSEKSIRDKAPKTFLDIYDSITNYQHPDAVPWVPEYIEVMVWSYDYAPDESVIWPVGWPDTKSNTTKKRTEGYSIYLPVQYKQPLTQLISSMQPRGALEINGEKWAVDTRVPFPHETP